MTVREKLDQLFPQGCHCVFIGNEYAESWDESMDDAIVVGFPYAGDGMSREAMMDDAIVIQDDFNDSMNAMREATDLGWPRTFISCEEDEFDAIQDQKSEPYAFSPMKARAAMPLEQQFFRNQTWCTPCLSHSAVGVSFGPVSPVCARHPAGSCSGQVWKTRRPPLGMHRPERRRWGSRGFCGLPCSG